MAFQPQQGTTQHWWLGQTAKWYACPLSAGVFPKLITVSCCSATDADRHRSVLVYSRRAGLGLNLDMLALAGVNMRLEPGAIRELHWHQSAEVSVCLWTYMDMC